MASGTIKLFKLASEINIGKDAIVEYLQSKGFDIVNKPTQNLTEEMVDLVFEKFKREKKIAEVQREKIQKHKDVKQEVKKTEKPASASSPSDNKKEEILRRFEEAQKKLEEESHQTHHSKKEDKVEAPAIVEHAPVKEIIHEPVIEKRVEQAHKVEEVKTAAHINQNVDVAPPAAPVQKAADHDAAEKVNIPKKVHEPKKENESNKEFKSEFKKDVKQDIKPDHKQDKPKPKKSENKEFQKDTNRETKKDHSKSAPREQSSDPSFVEPTVGQVIDLTAINMKPDFDRYGNYVVKGAKPGDRRDRDNRDRDRNQGQNQDRPKFIKDKSAGGEDRPPRQDRQDRPGRPDNRQDRPDRPDNRQDRPERRFDRQDRPDNRSDRSDNRQDRPDNRQDRPDNRSDNRGNRPDGNKGNFKQSRPDRPDRPDNRQDRPDNRPDNRGNRPDGNKGSFNRPDQNRPKFENKAQDGSQQDNAQSADRQRKKRKSIIQVGYDQPKQDKTDRPDRFVNRTDKQPGEFRRDDDRRKSFGGANLPFESPKLGGIFIKDADKPKAKETQKAVVDRDERKKKKRKKSIRESISQDEVNRAIKETLTGMDTSSSASRAKIKMKKKAEREEKELKMQEEKDRDSKILQLAEFVATSDLANLMGIAPSEIILKCMGLGLMVTINQRLDKETITLIADDYGFTVEFMDDKEIQFIEEDEDEEETLKPRAPIVTIMGHVDHGKTSLLDNIRHTNVVAGEAGGITQHIGAYSVEMPDGRSITFLDTPGHEAFTAMRARGAQVTDLVVLVVAADDSVMPQTIEAISHAKAANVPIVVAINKIDKPDANPDRIRQQLADYGVLVEEWGGKNQCAEISAKKAINLDQLLEKILLEAELLNLTANPDRTARGTVIESHMSKGYGAVSTLIIQKGTLKVGDPFVSGVYSGRVRALLDERENKVEFAGPADPIRVIGCDGLPEAGDSFKVCESDSEARSIANQRMQMRREQELRQVRHVTLDDISAQILIGGVKDLNLIIKGDVAGSVEALSDSLMKLSREEVRVAILHKGVGSITETDVMLASASNAIIIGFNSIPTNNARKAADTEKVEIRNYNIIYDCINEIQLALEGMLTPDLKEEITSSIEIRKVYKISRIGAIAGCYVLSGKITRNDKVRVMRNGFKVWEGGIDSLKRGKDDVKEVDTGFECGIQLDGFNDIEENDIIEGFKVLEVKRRFK